jgi:hypothetical protein
MPNNNSTLINRNLISNNIFNILQENNFFHDSYLEKINFSILRNKLTLELSNETSMFSISIDKIFKLSCEIDFLVTERYFSEISWDETFKPLPFRHLLSIEIKESQYNKIATKYMNSVAKKAILTFDFKYNLEIDFIDIKIEKMK